MKKTERMKISVSDGPGKPFRDEYIEVEAGTAARLKRMSRAMDGKWCRCPADRQTFGSYPQNGECPCGMFKHHVHCGTCGKISQIG